VATEAAWLNGKRERKNSCREQNTLDRDRPSHGRHFTKGLQIKRGLATEAAWLNGKKKEELMERAKNS